MTPTIETYSDTSELVTAAGDRLVQTITDAIGNRGVAHVVLTGAGRASACSGG